MQSNVEQWRFWTAVRAEMRATWWGRWRWLWIGLGVACMGIAVVIAALDAWMQTESPGPYRFTVFMSAAYIYEFVWLHTSLAAVASWPAAWLGSDLLSLRFAGNPHPLREWRPEEFLARFVGRLAPLLGVVGTTAFPVNLVPVGQFDEWPIWLVDQAAFTSLWFATVLAYAAEAVLASSLTKRPRRGLITVLVMFANYLLFLGIEISEGLEWLILTTQRGWDWWIGLAAAPYWPQIHAERVGSWWPTVGVLLAVAIVAGLWIWLIAARRYRRSRAVQRDE